MENDEQPIDDEKRRRDERKRFLNASAKEVRATDFVENYLPNRPEISKEFVPSTSPVVLDDSKPYRAIVGGSGGNGTNSAPSSVPTDSKRNRFDPKKHLLGDNGKPVTTASGRFKGIPAKDRDRIAREQVEKWARLQSEPDSERSESRRREPVEPEDAQKHAGLWIDFCECVFTLIGGEKAKMKPLPNGAHEKELMSEGVSKGFEKWGLVKFPAILGLLLALGAYVGRVARHEKRPKGNSKTKEAEIISVRTEDKDPRENIHKGANPEDLINQL